MKKCLWGIITLMVFVAGIQVGIRQGRYLEKREMLRGDIEDNRKTASVIEGRLERFEKELVNITVTAYSPKVEECDDTPYVTASQRPVREGTIAVSRDLEKELGWKLGDRVYLDGLGVFEVWDRMHRRWEKRVDVFFFDTNEAKIFGVKKTVAGKIGCPNV